MLDCGEGSWGQMIRRYGQDGSENLLKKMKFIFISHNHADHHMGITRVLKQREQVKIILFIFYFVKKIFSFNILFLDFRKSTKRKRSFGHYWSHLDQLLVD